MPATINIYIASVNLSASCRDAIILPEKEPSYSSFVRTASCRKFPDITVALEINNMPDTSGLPVIFDSGQSWLLYQNGDDLLLTLRQGIEGPVIWTACFRRPADKVTIFCSELLQEKKNGVLYIANPVRYPLDQLVLMYVLANRRGALMHAAGADIQGRGCIFPGRSGAGKSTLSHQFRGRAGVQLLSDDRIVARRIADRYMVFGTPWPGDEGIAENKSAPVSGIFFLHQAGENRIKEVTSREALERLFPVTSIPWYDEEAMNGILSFCEELVSDVPAYELHFRPDHSAVEYLEGFISE